MKQVLLTAGGVEVRDVPAPGVDAGSVLVRVHTSCISVGTEMSGVRDSNLPLWKRAMQRPQQLPDRLALHVLHHQVAIGLPVDGLSAGGEGAYDRGVVDARSELGLALEPLERRAFERGVRVEDLDGDGRSRRRPRAVLDHLGAPHRAHPAGAELRHKAAWAEPLELRKAAADDGVIVRHVVRAAQSSLRLS